jgi:hypothetical protein
MEINWQERRARFEAGIQYRTYLNLCSLAYSEAQAGRADNYRHFKAEALNHRYFAKVCAYIATGQWPNHW